MIVLEPLQCVLETIAAVVGHYSDESVIRASAKGRNRVHTAIGIPVAHISRQEEIIRHADTVRLMADRAMTMATAQHME